MPDGVPAGELPLSFWILSATIFGVTVGSFLNVVIHRLPIMMRRQWERDCAELEEKPLPDEAEPYNLVVPRSRCPQCGHFITALENIPVFSYLFLKGKCSDCATPIPLKYPAVELLTALLSVAVVIHYGPSWQAAAAVLFTWSLVAMSGIDLETTLLPDSITLPFLWLGLLLNTGSLFTDIVSAVIGAAAGYLILWSIYHVFKLLTGKEGMGYGDFKLLAMLGAWAGWQVLPVIILLSSLVGAIVGIALILWGGKDRNTAIPFGPYLAIAGWIGLLWGRQISDWYLALAT